MPRFHWKAGHKNLNFNRHISLEPKNMSTSLKYLIIGPFVLKSSHNIGSRGVNARIVSVCANILIVSRRPHSAIFCARKYLPSVTQHTRSSGSSGLFHCSNNHQFFDENCGETAWYSTSKQASIDCPTRPIRMTET